jgi:uncharacterized membrane protein
MILLGIGLFFIFVIKNPTEPHFGLLKATRIMPISLLALTAYFLQGHLQAGRMRKGIAILLVLAFPSLITDNIVASDISNPSTYVRVSDMETAEWIKENLPKEAVQAEPNYPGAENGKYPKYAYSFIPIFSERRTGIGEWKVSSVEHSKPHEVRERFHLIKRLFSAVDIHECILIIKKYGIEYIYVGKLEKTLYPEGVKKFYQNGNLFKKIYSSKNVDIIDCHQVIEKM